MRVSDLQIRNFRGVREGRIRFGPHTVLIGPNNVGKTTLIEALALLFGRDRLVRELTEHDFTGSSPAAADRILLVATLTGFDTEDPEDHIDWFRDGRAVPKYLDQALGQLHTTREDQAWSLCCQIGFQARFDAESLSVETVRYFHDDDGEFDPFDGDAHVNVPVKLIKNVGFFMVRASRTWDGVISFGSELFRRTVAAANGQPAEAVMAERDRLRYPAEPIDEDARIRPLIDSIDEELARFLPRSPKLRLRLTTTDSRGVLEGVVAHFASGDAAGLPAGRQGSGLLSLQGLLLLLQFGRARIESGDGFLMVLEEPELHVPPQSQQRLVRRIQALSQQTIITTHSPGVASVPDPASVLILRNTDGHLVSEPLLQGPLRDDAPNWKRKLFTASRHAVIEALMYEVVLIPEGRSESEMLRAVTCALELQQDWGDAASRSFGFDVFTIPTEDAQVVETQALLARLHSRICCLVDGDEEGDRYTVELLRSALPPIRILRWPDGWAIEHVVAWILRADEPAALEHLENVAGHRFTIDEITARLEAQKVNVVLYEDVAEVIAQTPACAARARDLLAAITTTCFGDATPHFRQHPTGAIVFVP